MAEGWSQVQAARVYHVSKPGVSRFVVDYQTGGDLAACQGGGGPKMLRLPEHLVALREHAEAEPDLKLAARREPRGPVEGVQFSVSNLWLPMRAPGWTRKNHLLQRAKPAGASGLALVGGLSACSVEPDVRDESGHY